MLIATLSDSSIAIIDHYNQSAIMCQHEFVSVSHIAASHSQSRLIAKQVNEHVTRANAVYLLHLLHESVWSDLSDVINIESRAKATSATSHETAINRSPSHSDYPLKECGT